MKVFGRSGRVLLPAVAMTLGGAGSAVGAEVTVSPEELELGGPPIVFTAVAGETNDLTISSIPGEPGAAVFRDVGAQVTAGPGCEGGVEGEVVCWAEGLAGVRVLLDDGDDRLDASALRDQNRPPNPVETTFFSVEVEAGPGDDDVTGANASFACLRGGPGDDAIVAATTREVPLRATCGPSGGPGDDRLVGGPAGESLAGGPGRDSISGGPGRDRAAGGGDRDLIELGTDSDSGAGGSGDDRVVGGPGKDVLRGSDGVDKVIAGPGDDTIKVGRRPDTGGDELDGGPGFDAITFTCESCFVSFNARADDGERAGADPDNVLRFERAVVDSTWFNQEDEVNVSVGPGDDVISGNARANVLDGRAGPDLITGAGGADELIGGPGSDRIRAADGERDRLACGGGERDSAVVDRFDRVVGCERVWRGRA